MLKFRLFSIESFLTFSARTAIEHTALGTKQSIDLKEKVDGREEYSPSFSKLSMSVGI